MMYYKCTCTTTVTTDDLVDDLKGLGKNEFKEKLAEVIGFWCNFGNDSHFGRAFRKYESAAKGKSILDWKKDGNEWTFVGTVICHDWEDEINVDFTPYFEVTNEMYEAIMDSISEPEDEVEPFEEILAVKETHTYKLHDDWFMDIALEHNKNEVNGQEWDSWCGYIYRNRQDKRFVIAVNNKRETLKEFIETMRNELYDGSDFYFDDYDRVTSLIEEDNWKIIDEMEQ